MRKNNKIIVIKIGTGVLSTSSGELDAEVFRSICEQVAKLVKSGHKVIIVSSGAIGRGMEALGLKTRPVALSKLQATAAIGQSKLMKLYDEHMHKNGLMVAQVLLTIDDFSSRARYINAFNTMTELLYEFNVVPVINENDTIATEEIKFGDNDKLSALVANLMRAGQLIILTNVDGLKDPEGGKTIPLVTQMTAKIYGMAAKKAGKFGSGGMRSKLLSIKMAVDSGISCVIANGKEKDAILKIAQGESIGTIFLPKEAKHCAKKRWIAFSPSARGAVVVDDGAKAAIVNNCKSLLAIGIKKVEGSFESAGIISIKDSDNKEIARGVTNFSSKELNLIKGAKTEKIKDLLKREVSHDEVVHRDNMVIL